MQRVVAAWIPRVAQESVECEAQAWIPWVAQESVECEAQASIRLLAERPPPHAIEASAPVVTEGAISLLPGELALLATEVLGQRICRPRPAVRFSGESRRPAPAPRRASGCGTSQMRCGPPVPLPSPDRKPPSRSRPRHNLAAV